MATVIEKQLHPFASAKAAGREPVQSGRPRARGVRAQGNAPGRAGDARADVDSQRALQCQAAGRHAHHGQPAHDHPDGSADRDADRARRRRALGFVQHLLHPGSRRRGGRRRPAGKRRDAAESAGNAGVRVEGRVARRVLVVHQRGARVAGRQRADLDCRRRRRRHAGYCTRASSSRRRGKCPRSNRRAIRKSGVSSSI